MYRFFEVSLRLPCLKTGNRLKIADHGQFSILIATTLLGHPPNTHPAAQSSAWFAKRFHGLAVPTIRLESPRNDPAGLACLWPRSEV